MFLIHGGTVEERWRDFSEDERLAVCSELRSMTTAWRALTQDQQDCYVGMCCLLDDTRIKSSSNSSIAGNYDRKPLTEVFFWSEPKYQGPFYGVNAIQQLQEACRIETNPEAPITFTHNDLVPPNILLTPGPNPKVAAIIDWAQSGWYPSYWEYCKARYVNVLWGDTLEDTGDGEFLQSRAIGDKALQNEWWSKYLPLFLDPVDEEGVRHPWLYFALGHV